jgi:hypothetical protein
MKQHEREYFIANLRSGALILNERGLRLKIYTPTIDEECEANQIYANAYDVAFEDGMMSEDEMLEWMKSKGLWTQEDENRVKGLQKDIDRLKIEIFNARNNENLREHIRKYIRAGEKQLRDTSSKKHIQDVNTSEGLAAIEKMQWIIQRCTFLNSEVYDFDALSLDYVTSCYQSTLLSESQVRELSRSEPWRSLWSVHEDAGCRLFVDNERMLSVEQKNIIIWSHMYDNIHESTDCPSEDIIDDDDMLDGWLIIQRKKREKDQAEQEFEDSTMNSKIKSADEVFVMANNSKDAERIEDMNDLSSRMVKRQREAQVRQQGAVTQSEFQDEKLKLRRASNTQFKDKFGG